MKNTYYLPLLLATFLLSSDPAKSASTTPAPEDPGRISCRWDFDWKRHEGKDPYAGLKQRNRREVEREAKTLEKYGLSTSHRLSMVDTYNASMEKICEKRIWLWQESGKFGTAVQNAASVEYCTDYDKWIGQISNIKKYNQSLNAALTEEKDRLSKLYEEKVNAELKEINARKQEINLNNVNRSFINAWGRPVFTNKKPTKETAWEGFFSRRIMQINNELSNSQEREAHFNGQETAFQNNRKNCGDIIRSRGNRN